MAHDRDVSPWVGTTARSGAGRAWIGRTQGMGNCAGLPLSVGSIRPSKAATFMTREDLIAFEDEMAGLFNAGKIKAPLHLAGGNEDELIRIFKDIRPQDWVLCAWRSHYHCLLKGVPPALLRAKIIEGRSIALCFKEYRILSSAIVGGICPIAVGLAWAIKRRGGDERVWCFIGDMTARAGICEESSWYAYNHDLPLSFVIEDNHFSVCTPSTEVWGDDENMPWQMTPNMRVYDYRLTRPHVGTGTFVRF